MKDTYRIGLKTVLLVALFAGLSGCSAWYSVFGMNRDEAKKVYATITSAWGDLMSVETSTTVTNPDGSQTMTIATPDGALSEEIYLPFGATSGFSSLPGSVVMRFNGYNPAGGDYTINGTSDISMAPQIASDGTTVKAYGVIAIARGVACTGGPINTLDFALQNTLTNSTSTPGAMDLGTFSGTITVNNDTFDVADLG